MTTASPITQPTQTTDAQFRAWGSSVGTTLASLGLVRTSDTGQINWATVLTPSGANQSRGYEIFRFDDALQATAPVYIKLEYGAGSVSAGYPGMWITVGTGTDGAGNLTGQISLRFGLNAGGSTASNYSSRYACSSNRLAVIFWQSSAGAYNMGFSVERSHASDGNDTADGILITVQYQTGSAATQYVPMVGTVPSYQQKWNSTLPPTFGTGAYGADIYLYPVRAWGLGESCASLCFFNYFNADLTANNPTPATLWDGSSHSIYPTGITNSATFYGGVGYLAMRWD